MAPAHDLRPGAQGPPPPTPPPCDVSLDERPGIDPEARVPERRAWLALGALTLAAALVFWLFDALPFQDLPAHAGLIALRHRFSASSFDRRFFVLSPHLGPYSLFRFLGELFVVPLGPVGAVRAIATLPVVATPAALLFARRRLHGDRSLTAAYFGLALSFGFMTLLGFASYLLGVAVLVVGLTLWLELLAAVDGASVGARGRRARGRREAFVACFAPFVFVAHGHAFVLLVALAGVAAVATGRRGPRLARMRAFLPALALAAWVAWRERASVVPFGSVALPSQALVPHFQGPWDKLSLLLTPTLMTRTGLDALVGLFVWSILGVAVAGTVRSLRASSSSAAAARQTSDSHTRALFRCAAALSVAFLALPHSIGWFGFVDGRLVPLLWLLAVMGVQPGALRPRARLFYERGARLAACTMVALVLGASALFQREARGWREVLASVPADARLLNLPLEPDSAVFTAHPFVHYDKLVVTERPVLVSDVWFHQGSALYPTVDNPALRLPPSYSESDLHGIDWPAYRLQDWTFVLVRTRPSTAELRVPGSLELAAHRGGWWLFRTR